MMASVSIRPTKGGGGFSLEVDLNVEAGLLISTIESTTSFTSFKLVFRGTVLKPDHTLTAQGVKAGSTLVLMPEVKEQVRNSEAELITQLKNLGYSEKLARAAAVQVGSSIGCVERAIDWLSDNRERLERIEKVTMTTTTSAVEQRQPPPRQVYEPVEEEFSGPEQIKIDESEISSVYCWGSGSSGQLGTGNTRNELVPRIVVRLSGIEVVQVACGGQHSVALTRDGKLYQWGKFLYRSNSLYDQDKFSECRAPMLLETVCEFANVVAGGAHNLALDLAGKVYSWGEGLHGQLGHGSKQNEMLPRLVVELASVRIKAMAAGSMHSVVLCETGDVIVWGKNNRGQLGLKHLKESDTPQLLRIGDEELNMDWQSPKAKQISCGPWHTLVVVEGSPGLHSFGNDRPPLFSTELDLVDIRATSCDHQSSFLLTHRGDFYEWGPQGLKIIRLDRAVKAFSTGSTYLILLLDDGVLMARGDNGRGQLGIGSLQTCQDFVPIRGLTGAPLISIACGSSHNLAVVNHERLQQSLFAVQDHDWADITLVSREGLTVPCYSILCRDTLEALRPEENDSTRYLLPLSYQGLGVLRQFMYSGLLVTELPAVVSELQAFAADLQLKNLAEVAKVARRTIDIKLSLSLPEAEANGQKCLFEIRKKVFQQHIDLSREHLRTQAVQAAEAELRQLPAQPIAVLQPDQQAEPDEAAERPQPTEDRDERRRRLIEAAERRAQGQ